MSQIRLSDYSLVGKDTELAIEKGLAEATWYASPVPKVKMRELLHRRDGPAIRDTIIWFGLLIAAGYLGYRWWGTWWAIIPFTIYGVIYASTSDSRWHESGHGTAFKTDWLNNALYEVASFMVLRESVPWRWSHTRHHSDTIIVGRDPEIAVPRPPDLWSIFCSFFNLKTFPSYARNVLLHCIGKLTPAEKTYIPESEYHKVFLRARIYVLIYATVIGLAIHYRSFLPLMYIGPAESVRRLDDAHLWPHLALSEAPPEDNWTSCTGYIHEVLQTEYLAHHKNLNDVEFYMCGPPAMIHAAIEMLRTYDVKSSQIACDEF